MIDRIFDVQFLVDACHALSKLSNRNAKGLILHVKRFRGAGFKIYSDSGETLPAARNFSPKIYLAMRAQNGGWANTGYLNSTSHPSPAFLSCLQLSPKIYQSPHLEPQTSPWLWPLSLAAFQAQILQAAKIRTEPAQST